MKKIVSITGGTSFLGEEIIKVLKEDFTIRSLSRKKQHVSGVETFTGDITNDDLLKRFIKNSAVLVHVLSISNPFDKNINDINVSLTQKLIDMATQLNVHKVIYISSENVSYDLKDTYTKTKQEAEKIVSNFKNVLILRPSPIFGKEDNRHIMKYAKLVKNSFIIPVLSPTISKIQPIHVNDVAHIVKRAIEKDVRGTYTIVGTTPLSFKDLGLQISTIYGKKRWFITVPNKIILLILLFLKFLNQKLYSTIKNALVMRDRTNPSECEQVFEYSLPLFSSRLRDSLLPQFRNNEFLRMKKNTFIK